MLVREQERQDEEESESAGIKALVCTCAEN